jgi:hypothetical protein
MKNKPVVEDTEVVEETKTKKVARTEATVEWRGESRTYTLAMHGEDFEALAEEFAAKKNGRIV